MLTNVFVYIYNLLLITFFLFFTLVNSGKAQILNVSNYKHYIDTFNENYEEKVVNAIDNAFSWQWMVNNIPFFDSPDKELEKTYYFRWWTYRKHIKNTPDGYIITEFLPEVPWSGKHNAIVCPTGHHFYEGRWLHNREYLADYAAFWFRKGGDLRSYSSWLADALYNEYLVSGNKDLAVELLPDLVKNFKSWEQSNRDPNGLYWQRDGRDGMEISIGGHGYRATINSYMYGDAKAISKIAGLADKPSLKSEYDKEAQTIKELIQKNLWDEHDDFFKVLPRGRVASLADVRELHGYVRWYFGLPV